MPVEESEDTSASGRTDKEDDKSLSNRILESIVMFLLAVIAGGGFTAAFRVVGEEYLSDRRWRLLFFLGVGLLFTVALVGLMILMTVNAGGKPF